MFQLRLFLILSVCLFSHTLSAQDYLVVVKDDHPAKNLYGCKNYPRPRVIRHLSIEQARIIAEIQELIAPENKEKIDYSSALKKTNHEIDNCGNCALQYKSFLYLYAGHIKHVTNDIDGAIGSYENLAGISSHIPKGMITQMYYLTAQLLEKQERHKEAINYYNKWESLCPASVPDDYMINRAELFLITGDDISEQYYLDMQASRNLTKNKRGGEN